MRPNQQNKNRQRGRNNNGGRKYVNPLNRNFESNGPDVKVRGNASHIFEKYLQLARDAQSSGDSVMAENYLQHAEHYFRIVQAAQPQNQQRPDQIGQDDEDDDFPPINDRFSSPEPRNQPYQQQGEQQPQQSANGTDGEPGEPAPLQAEAEGQGAEADGEPRRHRDRSRRRRRGNGEAAPLNGDPASAPQPDVGELPAFLTAGTTGPAE